MNKKIFWCVLYTISCFFLFITDVHAYVDPSVLTYAIQATAGIIIALSTVVGVYLSRIRKTLNIQTKKKETESDVLQFLDPSSGKTITTSAVLEDVQGEKTTSSKNKKKIHPAALALPFALSFITCFYEPLFIYFTNIIEFSYQISDIFPWIFLLFVIIWIILTAIFCIAGLISRRLLLIGVFLAGSLFFAMYIQGTILIGDLPPTDGTMVDWGGFAPQKMQSLVLFVSVFVINAILLFVLKPRRYMNSVAAGSLFVSAVLFVTLAVTCIQNNGFQARTNPVRVTNYGMNFMSDDENVIVLVLDAMDGRKFRELYETRDPEYKEIFRDFTFYPDTLAAYPYTQNSLPFIFSGLWNENEKPFIDYYHDALDESVLFRVLEQEGYSMGLFENDLLPNQSTVDRFENITTGTYGLASPVTFMMDELRMSFYMFMPYQLKHFEPSALYNLIYVESSYNMFKWDDLEFWNYMHENGIEHIKEKRLNFIHLQGAHLPFRYDKNLNIIPESENPTYTGNVEASITLTEYYLECLKKEGVYDNSVIIILGDHGFEESNDCYGRQNALLLIKGRNEHHDFSISDSAVSFADLNEAYNALIGGSLSESLFSYSQERPRRYLFHEYAKEDTLTEYQLIGSPAWDTEALKETGNTFVLK